jgi:hypothetical protein
MGSVLAVAIQNKTALLKCADRFDAYRAATKTLVKEQ